MPKIFISYGRDESHGQNLATEAQKQLEAAGYEVFRDVVGLKPGDVWYSKLEFELDTSDLVILIVSEKIRTSEWVYNEFSLAKEIGLPIIPVIAEQVRMPLWLRHLQTLDFSIQADWKQLVNAMESHEVVLENDDEIPVATELVAKPREVYDFDENDLNPVALPRAARRRISANNSNESDPSWASETGKDQYGQYADLEIKKVTQRFRLIHPGTFQMGSPEHEKERNDDETLHQVTLSEAFWLADTACTQALWLAIMGNNPSNFKDNKNNPVEQVSWDDIHEFIQELGALKSGVTFQLPTEVQWEYACRAGTTTPFSFGDNITSEQVNYNGKSHYKKSFFQKKDLTREKTLAVQSLPANRWGLYEMHGNVSELCLYVYSELRSGACTDPYTPSGVSYVLRGGSWFNRGEGCRSACRSGSDPSWRFDDIGFRLSLDS